MCPQLLGVSRGADEAEIKKAYRKAALKYHPDRQSSKTEQEKEQAGKVFRDIAEAYEVRGKGRAIQEGGVGWRAVGVERGEVGWYEVVGWGGG